MIMQQGFITDWARLPVAFRSATKPLAFKEPSHGPGALPVGTLLSDHNDVCRVQMVHIARSGRQTRMAQLLLQGMEWNPLVGNQFYRVRVPQAVRMHSLIDPGLVCAPCARRLSISRAFGAASGPPFKVQNSGVVRPSSPCWSFARRQQSMRPKVVASRPTVRGFWSFPWWTRSVPSSPLRSRACMARGLRQSAGRPGRARR